MEMQDTLILASLTQTEINNISTPETGGVVYNSTTNTVQGYNGSTWVSLDGVGDLLAINNLSDVTDSITALSNLGGEPIFSKNTAFNKDFGTIAGTVLEGNTPTITGAESTKLAFITVTQAVDLDTIESDVAANNAKVTNATHTGEVTGSGGLTVDPTAISNKASVTAAAGMEVLVNDAGTLKKADASDFLGGGGTVERFNLSRVETIDENSATPKEYFTFVQGGTEISNVVSATGGDYEMVISIVCTNTSTGGSIIVDPDIGGVSVFSQPFTREPKDTTDVFYVSISKDVTLAAGNNTINLQLSNSGGGIGRIFEANITLTKV